MIRGIIFFLYIFVCGCAAINSSYAPDEREEAYMQATRKAELIEGDSTKIVVIATRLNMINQYHDSSSESFVFEVYESGDGLKDFLSSGYKLYLSNNVKPVEIKKMSASELSSFWPSRIKWGQYYLVKFPPQNKKVTDSMTIVLEHNKYGKNFLEFGFKKIDK